MNILINIRADSFLLCHEALSLALALAAFEHQIQLSIGAAMLAQLMTEQDNKLTQMIASFELYDIAPAWLNSADYEFFVHWRDAQPTAKIWFSQLTLMPQPLPNFDTIFNL